MVLRKGAQGLWERYPREKYPKGGEIADVRMTPFRDRPWLIAHLVERRLGLTGSASIVESIRGERSLRWKTSQATGVHVMARTMQVMTPLSNAGVGPALFFFGKAGRKRPIGVN